MIILRKLEKNDFEKYRYWKLPIHNYHKLNGPYFKKKTELEIDELIEVYRLKIPEHIRIIANEDNEIIGEVSWYWKSKETLWLEIGIVIFNEKFWGKGIGYQALQKWINLIFESEKEIVRIGLTTWSGNEGMIKLSEKLGLKEEARYKKARIVNGQYFDSVSYGILKEEWKTLHNIV